MPQQIELAKKQILDCNLRAVEAFTAGSSARRAYRRLHPTEVVVTKCMDGRVDFPRIAGLPFGLFTPYRNIGGAYDLGWPLMAETMKDIFEYAHSRHRPVMVLITYHFSASDTHLGCKGFGYDKEAAIASMRKFKSQIDRVYQGLIFPVLVGIETDLDAMIIHGDGDDLLDVGILAKQKEEVTEEEVVGLLDQILKVSNRQVIKDLAPLLVGNVKRIKELICKPKEVLEVDHRESVLALGQGFDWLKFSLGDDALVIGPCDRKLHVPIVTAAKIIQNNLRLGRIRDSHGILLISTPFRSSLDSPVGHLRRGAEERSRYLASFAMECLEAELPEMAEFLVPMIGITDWDTREYREIE